MNGKGRMWRPRHGQRGVDGGGSSKHFDEQLDVGGRREGRGKDEGRRREKRLTKKKIKLEVVN